MARVIDEHAETGKILLGLSHGLLHGSRIHHVASVRWTKSLNLASVGLRMVAATYQP